MTDPARVLIVEDDDPIAEVLHDYLVQAGYQAQRLNRADTVLPWLAQHPADVLLLDLMLPGGNGLDICRALRPGGQRPVGGPALIMVTARVDEIDRLIGLEAGADDYVCKPFSPREVVARVKAVLRRPLPVNPDDPHSPPPPGPQPLPCGLLLDVPSGRATLAGHDLGLTAVELKLLATLCAQAGRIFSRDQLMDAMYRDERVVADRTVDSHVKKLRRKLQQAQPGAEALVHSVYGMGYKFEG